jgi:hypothetical protein
MTTAVRKKVWQARVVARKADVARRTKQLDKAKRRYDKDQHSDTKHLYQRAKERLDESIKELKTAQDAVAKLSPEPLRIRAYNAAKHLVGVMEQGGNNQGPMVTKIIRANAGSGPEPWCGDFVAYCYRQAGSKRVTRSWASVALLRGVLGIVATSKPQTGDLVRYNFSHVGMFVRDLGNGYIETIEGNTGATGAVSDSATGGDGVYIKHRPKSLVKDYLHVSG